MVSVTSVSGYITSASCYHPSYQSRSLMYIPGLIQLNWPRQFRLDEGSGCFTLIEFLLLSVHLCVLIPPSDCAVV